MGLHGEEEIWPEHIYEHFKFCGEVKRIIIKIDKVTGERMGFAYVDFGDEVSAQTALSLDQSEFYGRTIKVSKKRSYSNNNNNWNNNNKGGWKGGFKGAKGGGKGGKNDWWNAF